MARGWAYCLGDLRVSVEEYPDLRKQLEVSLEVS